ncbi:hypothetical protein [Desulfobulbus elongatus]|uniref:hypothetical protein n=1 Tax=Desulfobulbus elongatus TaxID=53332 RepID=UPI00055023D5|nr:hypothetical protein [Desulfobulbus elongatus]
MSATLIWRITGGADNNDPYASLGGVRSSNIVSEIALNNLFDDVSPAEASAGDTEYRAIDLYNSGDAPATGVVLYNSAETSSAGTTLDFGIEASPIDSTTSIANESTAPIGVSFSHPTSDSKLSIPNIAAGSGARVWVRRVVDAATANTSNDQGTFTIEYA